MFSKLLALFKDKPVTEDIQSVIPDSPAMTHNNDQMDASPVRPNGRSVHLGYNYLKGMNEYDDSSNHIRRFMNLHKLLRGGYHAGKIAASHAESEGDVRGEDSE